MVAAAQEVTGNKEPVAKIPLSNGTFLNVPVSAVTNPDGSVNTQAIQAMRDEMETTIKVKADNDRIAQENIEKLRQVSNMIVTTPIGEKPFVLEERPAEQFASPMGPSGLTIKTPSNDPSRLAQQAWEKGVDVESGTKLSDRWALGIAEFQNGYLKFELMKQRARADLEANGVTLPEGVSPLYIDEDTGRLTALRAITDSDVQELGEDPANIGKLRPTLVDPVGFDLGDITEFAPNAPIIGAEIAGGLAVGAATKSPGAALGASSAITATLNALSVPARKKILVELYGMDPEEVEQASNPNEWLKQAALSGGSELVFGGFLEAVRRFRNATGVIEEKDIPALLEEHKSVMKEIEEFSEATGTRLDMTPDSIMSAAGMRADGLGSTRLVTKIKNALNRLRPVDRIESATGQLNQRLQIRNGWDSITNQAITEGEDPALLAQLARERALYAPDPNVPADARMLQAGEATRQTPVGPGGETFDEATQNAERVLNRQSEVLADLEREIQPTSFNLIESATADSVERANQQSSAAWLNLENLIGVDDAGRSAVQVRNTFRYLPDGQGMAPSPIREALQSISKEGQEALSQRIGAKSLSLVEDMSKLAGDQVDLRGLTRLQSQLKFELRALERAQPSNYQGYSAEQIKRLIGAIDNQINEMDFVRTVPGTNRVEVIPAAEKADIIDAYAVARDATLWQKRVAQADTVRELTNLVPKFAADANGKQRLVGYEFDNFPREALTDLLSKPNALQDVIRITGNDPKVKAAFARELETMYNNAVAPDGKFMQGAHSRFMNQYGDQMDLVFGQENRVRIRSLEQMRAAAQKAADTAQQVEKIYIDTFGPSFIADANGRLAPDNVVSGIFGNSKMTSQQARNLFNRLNEVDPVLATQLRAETGQWMANNLTSGPLMKGDGNAIRKLIQEQGGKIGAVMGQDYVQSLNKIARVLDIDKGSRVAGKTVEPIQPTWLQITRSIFGPLSRKQRFISAYNRYSRSLGAAKAVELLSDPAMLKKFTRLEKYDPQKFVGASLIGSLGLREYYRYNDVPFAEDPRATVNQIPTTEDLRRFGGMGSVIGPNGE